ncbi:hypothetical protein QZM93_10405 [Burkholderia cepacia]|nr:hypothetical protein [Burkholderia cepacia]MDN7889015.1 hypothetical protein [Burkholderia cepacia]
MATKRLRPSGTWEYIIRRSKLLPKPLSLTFQSEEEGDAYVARLEQLLDAGIVPADVVEHREMISTVQDAIREYLRRVWRDRHSGGAADQAARRFGEARRSISARRITVVTLNGGNKGKAKVGHKKKSGKKITLVVPAPQ